MATGKTLHCKMYRARCDTRHTIVVGCILMLAQAANAAEPGVPELIREALGIAEKLGEDDKNYMLSQIITSQTKVGDFEGARKNVGKISTPELSDYAIGVVGGALAEKGDVEEAKKIREANGKAAKPWVDYGMVRLLLQKKDMKGAVEVAAKIESEYCKTLALDAIGTAQALTGDTKEAGKTIEQIATNYDIAAAYAHAATALAKAGKNAEAKEFIANAKSQLKARAMTYPHAEEEIAEAKIFAGVAAKDVMKDVPTEFYSGMGAKVALALFERGDMKEGRAVGEKISEETEQISYSIGLSKVLLKTGEKADAENALKKMRLTIKLNREAIRAIDFKGLAEIAIQLGDAESAAAWARELGEPKDKVMGLLGVAERLDELKKAKK